MAGAGGYHRQGSGDARFWLTLGSAQPRELCLLALRGGWRHHRWMDARTERFLTGKICLDCGIDDQTVWCRPNFNVRLCEECLDKRLAPKERLRIHGRSE